jgi:hypothetical protein
VSNIAHEIARVSLQNVVSPSTTNNNDDDNGLEEELRLATLLNEAFVEQQQAKLRAETVDQCLQKFDLDPQHAAILDTFDFNDIQQDGLSFWKHSIVSTRLSESYRRKMSFPIKHNMDSVLLPPFA